MAKVFHKKSQKASLLSLRNSKDRDLLDTLGTAMEAEEVPLTKKGKLSTEKDNGRGYQNQFFNEAKSSEFEENIGVSNELALLFGSNDVINKEEMFKKSSTLRILMVALNPAMRRMSQFALEKNVEEIYSSTAVSPFKKMWCFSFTKLWKKDQIFWRKVASEFSFQI